MVRVVVDAALAGQLGSEQPVYVYDNENRFLGIFRSEAYQQLREEAIKACPVSEQELRQRAERWQGRPLADILEDLERRAPSS